MSVNSDAKSTSLPAPLPPQLFASTETSGSITIQHSEERRAQSSSLDTSLASHDLTRPINRLSTSAIGLRTVYSEMDPEKIFQNQPPPKYHRRSIGVLPITRPEPKTAPGASPESRAPRIQPPSIPSQDKLLGDARFSLRLPLTPKTPNALNRTTTSPLAQVPTGLECPIGGSTDSSRQQQSIASEASVPVVEDSTPRMSHFSDHSSQADILDNKRIETSTLSTKLYSLLTSSGHASKNSERLSPRLKHGILSALNKSEPNLSLNSASSTTNSLANPDALSHSVSRFDASKATISPMTTQVKGRPEAQQGSPSLDTSDATRESSLSSQHQKMKSILTSTSKRISVFTSRLHYTSPANRLASDVDGSHVNQSNSRSDDRELRSPNIIANSSTAEESSRPTQIPTTSADQSPSTAVPLMSTDNSVQKILSASSNRIHSPGFYRSLKMRWKTDQSVHRELPSSPLNGAPMTDENKSQTVSNHEQLKRTPNQSVKASDDFLSPRFPVSHRSSKGSLADLMTSRGPRKKDPPDGIEPMGLWEPEGSKKMTPRPAQTHISSRPRGASTSSTVSDAASNPATTFKHANAQFNDPKSLPLQEASRQRHLSKISHRHSSKPTETPEFDFSESTLPLTSSPELISAEGPEDLAPILSTVDQYDVIHSGEKKYIDPRAREPDPSTCQLYASPM